MALADQTLLSPRTRHSIAAAVGFLMAILAFLRVLLPAITFLAQFMQFSLFERVALLVKMLSPLVSFLLAYGWVSVLLWLGSGLLPVPKPASRPLPDLRPRTFPRQSVLPPDTWEQPDLGKEHTIGIPALFQWDPTHFDLPLLPITPLPLTNPAWMPPEEPPHDADQEEDDAEPESAPSSAQAEPIPYLPIIADPSPAQEEHETSTEAATPAASTFSFRIAEEPPEHDRRLTMTLLKQVRAWVRADDGTMQEVKLRRGENGIRLLILASIVWRMGEPVDRDKLLTYVVARGKRRDMNTDQLSEVFDAAKKYLRQDLDRAVNTLEKTGHPLSTEVDFFRNEPGFYWLHPSCQIVDLEAIDAFYQSITIARKEGLLEEKLDGSVPQWVIDACQKLIDAYPGDFLQELIEKFPEECGPWIREPFTLYRDRYLDALLVIATYESALGRARSDEALSTELQEEQRRHSARAAQLFYDYAMYALNSVWDRKLKFAYRAGKDGERVIRAARALRRCVVELGKLGQPDMIDQVYLAFKERMSTLSEGHWKPDQDTERDVIDARKTTSAYRFSSQIATIQPHPIQS